MTVKDLKKELESLDDSLDIYVDDNCGGGYELKVVKVFEFCDGNKAVELS